MQLYMEIGADIELRSLMLLVIVILLRETKHQGEQHGPAVQAGFTYAGNPGSITGADKETVCKLRIIVQLHDTSK